MRKRKNPIEHIPTDREISLILSRKPPRVQTIFVLGDRLGLRASEIVNSRVSDIDWKNKTISFIGKGNKPATLPLTDEILGYLHRALQARPTNLKHNFLIWNTRNPNKGITRFTVYYIVKKAGLEIGLKLWPHLLRHKFGTTLLEKGDIYKANQALRHSRLETTKGYIKPNIKYLRSSLQLLDSRPWFVRFLSKFKSPIPSFLLDNPVPVYAGDTIGRNVERAKLDANLNSGIHTVIYGPIGGGASHLLMQIKGKGIFFIDDLKPPREKLIELCGQMKAEGVLLEMPKGRGTSAPLKALAEAAKDQHYTLVIDSISEITKEGIAVLRKLKRHFTIFTSVDTKNRGKAKDAFFGSHDVIEIDNFNSTDAYKLADKASIDLATTSGGRELFLKRVVAESKGNPKSIMEIIDKERRRGKIIDASTEISHEAMQEPISALPFLSAFAAIAVVARYGTSTVGMPDWKIISIIAIGLLLMLVVIDKVLKKAAE